MAKVINCECGETVRGETDDEVVAAAREHINAAHPEMKDTSDEQILSMAEEA
jgi:predicted small metal-binding protein